MHLRNFCRLCLIVVTVFFTNGHTVAYENKPEGEEEIETIEIKHKQTLNQLEKTLEKRRFDFYQVFNQYNSDPRFDMICKFTAPIGSKIKTQSCEPRYFQTKRTEILQSALASVPPGHSSLRAMRQDISEQKVVVLTKALQKEADEHTLALLAKHPELLKSFIRIVEAQKKLETAKNQ